MRNPPHTVQEAFNLADRIECQIQEADSFKLELTNDISPVEVNEISADETLGDEYEINEVFQGKKWTNNYKKKTKLQQQQSQFQQENPPKHQDSR